MLQHIDTGKNNTCRAVLQHIHTSKNIKARAIPQHTDTSKNIKASAVSQHTDISNNIKARAVSQPVDTTGTSRLGLCHNRLTPQEHEGYVKMLFCPDSCVGTSFSHDRLLA